MKLVSALCTLLCCSTLAAAQKEGTTAPKSVTVAATIDHNRVVINAEVRLPDQSSKTIRVWVDNGTAEFSMSRQLAIQLGLTVTCSDKECTSPAPREIEVAGMAIPLGDAKVASIPLKPVNAADVLASGMNVQMNLPATVLRHFDVLIDFPEHKFSIGTPGALHFRGGSSKVQVNAENGLLQIPSKIENKKLNLALDIGACISFLSDEIFDQLASRHAEWPRMTGAVGSANMWGGENETGWKVMRVDRVQYGPLFLTDVPFVQFPRESQEFFSKRAGVPTAGLLGSNVLLNYRVGLDYAHSMVYFEVGRTFTFPDFDVVGVVLRPEDDGNYTILGPAHNGASPSASADGDALLPGDRLLAINDIVVRGSTMGQVWSMLGGTPGQERRLTIERAGKQLVVTAKVQHFLAVSDQPEPKQWR